MMFFTNALQQQLAAGIKELGCREDPQLIENLDAYCGLLIKWNQHFNLTAITDPESVLIKHCLDSLSLYPYLEGENIIDVGSGAGLPGIPLALAYPEKKFVLLDSNSKKIQFLMQVKLTLGLNNVTPVHHRVENYRGSKPFDCIMSRAFANLPDFLASTSHLGDKNSVFLAMKGGLPQEEIPVIMQQGWKVDVKKLTVPGLAAERHLLMIKGQHA